MLVDFSQINRDDFRVSERDLEGYGTVILITPTFDKHKWDNSDRHLRSLMCSPSGEVLSSGFMKFHNHFEVPALDVLTERSILSGTARFAEKMDGSLLIRSVIGGQVHFRTRGSHMLGEGFKEPIEALIWDKYPNLMDPTKDSRYSILFEYTSPSNLIVIQYDDANLTALGMMDLSAHPVEFVSSPELVLNIEADYGTPAVKFHKLEGSTEDVIEHIKDWKGSEGIVVWCELPNGQMHLSKIKASEYIRIHSLKFQLTNDKVKQLCWHKDLDTLEQLKEEFYRLGVDWEAVSFIEPIFNEYHERKNEMTNKVMDFVERIEYEKVEQLESRKWKAIKLQEMAGTDKSLFSFGMQYVLGNKDLQPVIDAMTLGISTKKLVSFRKEAEALVEYVESKV